jgi:hypothetical protein
VEQRESVSVDANHLPKPKQIVRGPVSGSSPLLSKKRSGLSCEGICPRIVGHEPSPIQNIESLLLRIRTNGVLTKCYVLSESPWERSIRHGCRLP